MPLASASNGWDVGCEGAREAMSPIWNPHEMWFVCAVWGGVGEETHLHGVHAARGGLGDLTSGGRHPQAVDKTVLDETHRGDAAGAGGGTEGTRMVSGGGGGEVMGGGCALVWCVRLAVVRHPELVARLVGKVEVTARRDGEVGAVRVALDGVDRSGEVRRALRERERERERGAEVRRARGHGCQQSVGGV